MTIQPHQKLYQMISRKLFLLENELFPSHREKTRLSPPQEFSQIQMWIVLEETIDTTIKQDHFCLQHLISYTCHWNPSMVNGRLSLFLDIIIDYATFAPIMQLKVRQALCWNVPFITPLEISISFNWSINLTLTSISRRLLYFATLNNQSIWHRLDVLSSH